MLKNDLRSIYKNRRECISKTFLEKSSLAIAHAALDLSIWQYDYYHIFLSISSQKEIDTSFILAILKNKGKKIVLPKITAVSALKHYLLTSDTKLRTNRWNIREPIDGLEIATDRIDVVFVPLLAFDIRGNRVGYGLGFYDNFLRECRADVVKIGVSLFEPEEFIEDTDAYDIPLNYCITPERIYSFSGSAEG